MVGNNFFMELDNPVRSFFPGQQVSGRVVLESHKQKRTEGISVIFVGIAKVHWTESRTITTGAGKNRVTRTQTIHYNAEEEYFHCKINLIGNGGYEVTIPVGRHAYPFQFTLPLGLPSSFSGPHGKVGYQITATLQRSWRFNQKAIVPFTVNGILDLNVEPGAQNPIEIQNYKNICCLFCKSGPVGYVLKLKKSGFVSGEHIHLTAEIMNQSRRKVNNTKLFLIQETSFHARGKSRKHSRVICEAVGPGVDRGESECWTGKMFQLPPLPPTRLANCRIIEVNYFLKLEIDLSGPALNLKSTFPIFIGTIPMRNTFEELSYIGDGQNNFEHANLPGPSHQQPPAYSRLPVLPSAPGFENYPDLPPPTYAEAIGSEKFDDPPGDNETGHVNEGFTGVPSAPIDDGNYVPNYITYGWHSNAGAASPSQKPYTPPVATLEYKS